MKTHCPKGHALTPDNLRGGKRLAAGHRECLTCHRESAKRRYWKDPDTRRVEAESADRAKAWRKANPDRAKELIKRWHERHPEYLRNMRLMRQIGSEHLWWAEVVRRDPCSYCGASADAIDHVDPVSRGGDPSPGNWAAACRSCNSRKKNKPLLRFLLERA